MIGSVAILAGGLATRLRPITEKVPKVLVPVAERPFLAHQIEYLRGQGIKRIVLCVGYLGEMVREEFGDGKAWGIEIEYSFDGPVLLGTGGAVEQALPLLGKSFFVLYGDSYLPIDFQAVWKTFEESGKLGLMTVYPNQDRWDTSNVWFEDGQIRKYSKKDKLPEMRHIDYGLSVFQAAAFNKPVGDLADLMESLAARGEIAGFVAPERFFEIGSHAGLAELDTHLRQKL